MNEIENKQESTDGTQDGAVVYRPTFRSMLGTTLFVSIVSIALFISAVESGRIILAIFPLVFIGFLLAARFKLKIIADEKQVQYVGLFAKKTITFADVIHAGWMFQHGFSKDRFFGSLVYEVLSRKERIKINFRLFSVDQVSTLIQRLESLSILCDTADQSLRRDGTESMDRNSAQSTNTKAEK